MLKQVIALDPIHFAGLKKRGETVFPNFDEPLILSVELNTYCGLNCIFCKNNSIQKAMNDAIFEKLIEHIYKSNNLTTLAISGGEPFLDDRLERLLSVCRERKVPTSIDTNCNWDEIPETISKCGQIRIKLLSLKEDTHNILVGRKNYRKVIRFINWLTQNFSGSKVIFFPIIRQNLYEIDHVVNFALDKGFYCNFFPYPRGFISKPALSREEYKFFMNKLSLIFKRHPKNVFIDLPLLGLREKSLINICPAIFISSHIDVDGYLKICKFCSKKIGSLENLSLRSLWTNQKNTIKRFNIICSNCNFYLNCGGGCFVNKDKSGVDHYCPIYRNGGV